jgi:ABC-type xylose transport system permease subunit
VNLLVSTVSPDWTRHYWQRCVAVWVAAASFVLGQQKLLPALLRGSPLGVLPVFAPFILMTFWLLRARLSRMIRALGGAQPVGREHQWEAA